jgi:hypothetical protein
VRVEPCAKTTIKQTVGRTAFAQSALRPCPRHTRWQLQSHRCQKRRNRSQPGRDKWQSIGDGGEVADHQRDDAEDRFARPERRVLRDEVGAAVFKRADGDAGACHVAIQRLDFSCWRGSRQRLVDCLQLRDVSVASLRSPVWKQPVELMHSREGRVDGMSPEVLRQERIERGRQDTVSDVSGIDTQRRWRNERSTALISSCTCAPSSKLPSLSGPSLRISLMKERIRLA